MAQELFNKVVGPSHSDIEKRARLEREKEKSEAPVRMQGRGSARPPRVLDADSKVEDMEDNLEGLEEEGMEEAGLGAQAGGDVLEEQETTGPRHAPCRGELEVILEEQMTGAPRNIPGMKEMEVLLEEQETSSKEDQETSVLRDVPGMEELEALQEEQGPAAPRDAQGRRRLEVQKTSAPKDVPVLEEPEVFQKEQETPPRSGSHSDSVVLTPRIVTPSPSPVHSPLAHSSPTLEKSARRSLVFRSPVMRMNPPRTARHVMTRESDKFFTGVFGEAIDDSFVNKPYNQPEQEETDDDDFEEGLDEREMAEELAELVQHQDVQAAQLQAAQLQAAQLQAAQLQAAQLQVAQLQAAPLQAAPLQAAQLQAAPLQAAPLQAASLQAASLQAAQLQGPPLQAAQQQAAQLQAPQLQAPQLQAAQLQEDQLQEPEMEGPTDRYPAMAKVEPGVYRLPGRTVPFYITLNLNHCGACGQRTKKTWCSHLISAGMKEGYKYFGKEYLPSMTKVKENQRGHARKNGKKCTRHSLVPRSHI